MASAPLTAADILSQTAQARGDTRSQGTVIEQSRAIAEVQGALMVADRRPRDKVRALNEALESCRTREVAESAFYKFSRGGQSVAGETIHLARELARCWGNIVYAVVELDRDDGRGLSEMMAYAWDLETNARSQLQFLVPHFRDKKGGPARLTDMRDIYENNANNGARRLRECIFAVLPPYLVKSAAEQCHVTLQGGTDEKPLAVRVQEAIVAFETLGVSKDRIEAKMGPIGRFTPVDLANLRVSYGSIKRNEINADDEFPRVDRLTAGMIEDQAQAAAVQTASQSTAGNPFDEAGASATAPQEGRADPETGEITTLASAMDEISACEFAIDVPKRRDALLPLLSPEDGDLLREHAAEKVAALGGRR